MSPLTLWRASCLLATLAALSVASTAAASPWTLPQHEVVLTTSYSYSSADEEFLNDGVQQVFPLRGVFRSSSLNLGLRYGVTDTLEVEAQTSFKQVAYQADPVILDLFPEDLTRQQARDAIFDFSSSQFGAGDMFLTARYNLVRRFILVTPELSLKVPLGYDKPRGTFSNIERVLAGQDPTADIVDDATLGDGQVDLHAALLLGTFLPWTRTFIRAEGGYRRRFDSPGDQAFANVKAGQFLSDRLVVFAGVRYAKTVTEGEVIGQSFVDTNPTQPAREYVFGGNVEARDLTLDRDFTILEVGAILPLDKIELQISYEQIVTGVNITKLQTFNLGVIATWPEATKPASSPSAPPEQEEIIEEEIIIEPAPPQAPASPSVEPSSSTRAQDPDADPEPAPTP